SQGFVQHLHVVFRINIKWYVRFSSAPVSAFKCLPAGALQRLVWDSKSAHPYLFKDAAMGVVVQGSVEVVLGYVGEPRLYSWQYVARLPSLWHVNSCQRFQHNLFELATGQFLP